MDYFGGQGTPLGTFSARVVPKGDGHSTGYRIFDALFKQQSQGHRKHLVPNKEERKYMFFVL